MFSRFGRVRLTQPVLRALKKKFLKKETRPFCSLSLGLLGAPQELERELEGKLSARELLDHARGEGNSK